METHVPATTGGDIRQPPESTAAPAKTATRITVASSTALWKAIAPIAVALVLALLPAPSGLPQHAWYFFSIFVGVIVGLVLEPLPGAAVALIGLTLIAVLARFVLFSAEQLSQPHFSVPNAAITWGLSGYSNSIVWLIFGAFMIALGYERTGLGKRIALLLVKRLGNNTLLLGYGVTLADTILSPFIPSPTARSGGIIYPIAVDLARVYGSKPNDVSSRRIGAYLMWVAIATTCVTSSLFLTAGSFNLLAVGLVQELTHTDLHWIDWFKTAALAIIPLLILIPLLTYWLYPPEVKHSTEVSQWAASQLERIGRLTRHEMILVAVVVLSLALWVGGDAYVNAATVAAIAVSLLLITRVLTWGDIAGHKSAWTTFAWLGALIALCDGLNSVGFVKWFAGGISRHMTGFSPLLAMVLLLAIFFVAHYLFASVNAYVTALLPVILATGASIPGLRSKNSRCFCAWNWE